jgi:hypothetical protein
MITFIRTATAAPGKFVDLVAFAHQISEVAGQASGRKLTVATSFGGIANEVAWISTADNLGAMEEVANKLMASEEYRTTLKKAENLIVPGSLRDQVWRHT